MAAMADDEHRSGSARGHALSGADAVAVLSALFEGSSMGLGVWDRDLRYRLVNPALARMNGLAPEDHVGRTVQDVLGDLGGRLATIFGRIMETGEPHVDAEVLGETPKSPGVSRRWRASYYPVRGPDGEVLGIAGTVVETTSVVRARDAEQRASSIARAAGALLDAVFAAAPVGLAVWSPDLRFRRVNEALAAMNGIAAEAHVGRRIDDVLGEYAPRIRQTVEQVLATAEVVVDPGTAVDTDAGTVYFESSYFPIAGDDGEVTAVGAVVRDVTDRHRAEQDRARLLKEAVAARAQAEAARVRAEAAQRAAEEERRRTAFLARAGARMAASMDFETTLSEVVATSVPTIADWSTITLVEPDGRLRTLAVAHVDSARRRAAWELAERYPPRRDSVAGPGRVIRTGEPELFPDIREGMVDLLARDEEHRGMLRELGLRSSLVVPLRTAGGILGALSFGYAESGRHYTEDDVPLARALAARASLHIQNSRLYTELSHIAGTLQRSLLPRRLPEVPGVEVRTRYLAVGEYNEVGGDFFDLFPTEPGVWTALIGDVSGKGAEAAAITALARHTLRAAAMRNRDPSENLRLLNDTMLADSATSRFCTVSYARLCPGSEGVNVSLANGGHMPPLVLRTDGRVEHIELTGSLIGALPDPTFGTAQLRLGHGDLMLLYTDGVTDLRTRGPMSGERQLADTLESVGHLDTDTILGAVTEMAIQAQGGRQRDDIAMLALRAR